MRGLKTLTGANIFVKFQCIYMVFNKHNDKKTVQKNSSQKQSFTQIFEISIFYRNTPRTLIFF